MRRGLAIFLQSTIAFAGLIAVFLVALNVHLGYRTSRAEKKLRAGSPVAAVEDLSKLSGFANSRLLTRRTGARIHGILFEAKLATGPASEAIPHFSAELERLNDSSQFSSRLPSAIQPPEKWLEGRRGAEEWKKGYRSWFDAAPSLPPNQIFEFSPKPKPPVLGNAWPALRKSFPEDFEQGELIEWVRSWSKGRNESGTIRGQDFAPQWEALRRNSDLEGWNAPRIQGMKALTAGGRVVMVRFALDCDSGNEERAREAVQMGYQIFRWNHQAPSFLALMSEISMRSDWIDLIEAGADGRSLSTETLRTIAETVESNPMPPDFPEECFRHENEELRALLSDSLLGGSWADATPEGRRIYERATQWQLSHFQRCARIAMSEASDSEAATLASEFRNQSLLGSASLEARRHFSKLVYESTALTEEDGAAFADSYIGLVAASVLSSALPQPGPLGKTLQDLYEREASLITRLGGSQ